MKDQLVAVNPGYPTSQARAAETLFEVLRPFIADGAVNNIVDFRCGDGAILACLARRISTELGGSPRSSEITLHGYDVYADEVKKAEGRRFDTTCEVTPCPTEKTEERCRELADLKKVRVKFHHHGGDFDVKSIMNDKTAIICVGNSISALCKCQFALISQALEEKRPFMVAVDFNLNYMGHTDYTNPKKPFICNEPHQFHAAGSPKEYVDYISELGYLKVDVRTYSHGNGALQLFTLLRIDLGTGKRLNEAYYRAISSLVSDLFISKRHDRVGTNKGDPFTKLRTHFKSFFSTFGVAAILPFDQAHTFARYCAVDERDSPLFYKKGYMQRKYTMILEEHNLHQDTFHNAYGLYTAILAKITSPLIFSLEEMSEYNLTAVDCDFIEEERKLFSCKNKNGKEENSYEFSIENPYDDGSSQPFFTIPVYYATLPLFVIVVKFAPKIDQKNSGQRLVLEMLDNAHKAVVTAMDAAGLRQRTIRRFVSLAMQPQQQLPMGQEGHAPPSDSVSKLSGEISNLFIAHKNKPWKSWIHALPTQRLTDTDILAVANEGRQLERDFRNALNFAELDTPARISNIFDQIGFFKSARGIAQEGGHEFWNREYHIACLDRGAESLRDPETWKKMLGYSRIPEPFSRNVIDYMLNKLINLIDGTSCENETTDSDFNVLKSMFCGMYENSDSIFRFSVLRLLGLLECADWTVDLYISGRKIEYKKIGSMQAKLEALGGKLSVPILGDPSVGIAELAWRAHRLLSSYLKHGINQAIKLNISKAPSVENLDVDIEIPMPEIRRGGGSDKRGLIDSYMAITNSTDRNRVDEIMAERQQIALRFSVACVGGNEWIISSLEGFPS